MDSVEGISTRILLAILMEHTIVRDKFLGMVVESSTHRMSFCRGTVLPDVRFCLEQTTVGGYWDIWDQELKKFAV